MGYYEGMDKHCNGDEIWEKVEGHLWKWTDGIVLVNIEVYVVVSGDKY
jgi:hypothetical protein